MRAAAESGSFWEQPATRRALDAWVAAGLEEDCAENDITTSALFEDVSAPVHARITAEEAGVICGVPAAIAVFRRLDPNVTVMREVADGAAASPGAEVLFLRGKLGPVLAGERTALNLLAHLSGIATRASRWARAAGDVTVLDTRKTLPGIRRFQKHAVRMGGAANHRHDLAEFPLVKDNHRSLLRRYLPSGIGAADEIAEIVRRLRARTPGRAIEIEVEDYDSFVACLLLGVDLILIDNRSPEVIRTWIERARAEIPDSLPPKSRARLEASGGIREENLSDFVRSGVGRVSIGALTHSVSALDLSLHISYPEVR